MAPELEPIRAELTEFQKLELLRDEESRLREELSAVEKGIRDRLLAGAERQYLTTLSPYYAEREMTGADPAEIESLEKRRALIHGALGVVSVQRAQYEESLGTGPERREGRRQPDGGAKRGRFESFDEFRSQQGG